ncbi:MAG: putative GTPase [Sulfurimonas sp.]|jgi:predicted GTPase
MINDETFFELSALLLSLNRKTFETISSLKSFSTITSQFVSDKIENLDSLYSLQYSLIRHFIDYKTQSNIHHLHDSFNYLHKEGLLDSLSLEKLISLFDPSLLSKENSTEIVPDADENFNIFKQEILKNIHELKKVFNNTKSLEKTVDYLNSQTFSIGITGVMNAGKSTMLNALMGKDILGTSVVPETANLTIVKYSKTPSAKVVFWNKLQWQYILRSAKSIKPMEKFVEETQMHFKDSLDEYILQDSRCDEVSIDNLSDYTSASASDKKCNLVKYVELGANLSFLEDGIEIVDTPGLDDTVIQREEITKEYLSRCDVMIHLMNVSQSATLKDVEFIIDSVLYQNVTKVLVVITRVDMVSKEDVSEVIAYTKKSIASKLHEQNAGSKLDLVLKTLQFVALSGKMALMHKTGQQQEAVEAGYELEDTGILEIESYIQDTLFGKENSRTSLIVHSAKNRLLEAMDIALGELKYENSLLFKTEDEVDEELSKLKIKKDKQLEIFKLLKNQISGYEIELSNYVDKLQLFLDNELKKLRGVVKQRLIDETLYTLEKDKKTPHIKDQSRIIDSALKNGLIDIIRDYRHMFVEKSSKISEIITLQYDDIKPTEENIHSSFDYTSVFGNSFDNGFLTSNNEALVQKVSKLLSTASLKKITKTDEELSVIIQDEFVHIQEQLKSRALNLSYELLNEFIIGLKKPINDFEENLSSTEKLLQNHISFLNEDANSRQKKSVELYERINIIEQVFKRYSK